MAHVESLPGNKETLPGMQDPMSGGRIIVTKYSILEFLGERKLLVVFLMLLFLLALLLLFRAI